MQQFKHDLVLSARIDWYQMPGLGCFLFVRVSKNYAFLPISHTVNNVGGFTGRNLILAILLSYGLIHCNYSSKVSFSVIFEWRTSLKAYDYSRNCQTLGVSPEKPGIYP
jgi:hypothetical protein